MVDDVFPSTSSEQHNVIIEKVSAFGNTPVPPGVEINPAEVQLTCPPHILHAFQEVLRNNPILGTSFFNPYTEENEEFPLDANLLTARHLHILARNERENVTGKMKIGLYNNLLTSDQIGTIRCLVKATTIAGITYPTHSGGYQSERLPILPGPIKTIVVDQSGFQWQGDHRNTGGLFFYSSSLSSEYQAWQDSVYQVFFGTPRPPCSKEAIPVIWNGISGTLDLKGVEKGIALEFLQALDAVVAQGAFLEEEEQINFKFLKAGMGFFAAGLSLNPQKTIELARLRGIREALDYIKALPIEERRKRFGKIGRIEFPFSISSEPEAEEMMEHIAEILREIHIVWGGAQPDDAYLPRKGWVNATTNCASPDAMIGNEGGQASVDASLSTNAYLDHLNAGFNHQMILRSFVWDTIELNAAETLEQAIKRAQQNYLIWCEQSSKKLINAEVLIEKIKVAAANYLEWSEEHTAGYRFVTRFSHLNHGASGQNRVRQLLTLVEQNAPTHEIFFAAANVCEQSGNAQHSFSRFLIEEMQEFTEYTEVAEQTEQEFSITKQGFSWLLKDSAKHYEREFLQNLADKDSVIIIKKIQRAATNYLEWSEEHASGHRFVSRLSHFGHGTSGRERVERLLQNIKQSASLEDIFLEVSEVFDKSGVYQHSFSRFLVEEMNVYSFDVFEQNNNEFADTKRIFSKILQGLVEDPDIVSSLAATVG